jgi:hypothetical protein
VTLRLSARIDADRLVAEIEQLEAVLDVHRILLPSQSMIAGRESRNANRAFRRGDRGFVSRWIKPARLAFQAM